MLLEVFSKIAGRKVTNNRWNGQRINILFPQFSKNKERSIKKRGLNDGIHKERKRKSPFAPS